ncbi:MAG: F0F1 ATP synthase subunit gamma [Actinobacteria bacterium]|nr:F0F1 ATP synthase subunit gamma [Actinomycetota bacterium]
MASQQDIKQRITSITGTSKITRAMELVASAKLRRAQVRIEALRPYAKGMRRLMSGAARRSGSLNGIPLLEEREETRRASVIAVTGDRGLAGAFNVNVIRRSLQEADDLIEQGFDEVVFTAVGKKGGGTLRFRGKVLENHFQGFSSEPTFVDATTVADFVSGRFLEGEVDKVVLVFNEFKSVVEQRVTAEQLLPVPRDFVDDADGDGEVDEEHEFSKALAEFEPEPQALLDQLLPTFVNTTIYRALLESAAAEHAARRTAMSNASDNAGQLIDDLTLAMNRARQAAITQEILEVVAGADALS